MKVCSKCKENKELDSFGNDPRVKSGKQSICKECTAQREKHWHENHKEEQTEYARTYRIQHRDRLQEYYKNWKQTYVVPYSNLNCVYCQISFKLRTETVNRIQKINSNHTFFCSIQCKHLYLGSAIKKLCGWCHAPIIIQKNKIKTHNFCSRKCHGCYSANNKNHGIKRSKLEKIIEQEIKIRFPALPVLYNDLSAIDYELDFYFPSLGVAIELNGIFHYKPIFSPDTLERIKHNDDRKANLCKINNIDLKIIDTSRLTNTNSHSIKPYIQEFFDYLIPKFGSNSY